MLVPIKSIDITEENSTEKFTDCLNMRKMYMYIQAECFMANTKLFKNGNSQAVRIPAELAYNKWDIDLIIWESRLRLDRTCLQLQMTEYCQEDIEALHRALSL